MIPEQRNEFKKRIIQKALVLAFIWIGFLITLLLIDYKFIKHPMILLGLLMLAIIADSYFRERKKIN